MRLSADALAQGLGWPPRALSYPYGSYSRDTLRAARDAGFSIAVTTRRGRVLPGDDPLQLRRVNAHGTDAWHATELLKLSLAGAGLYPLRRERLIVNEPW